MEQRIELNSVTTTKARSIMSLADGYGVSRRAIYKWLDRHRGGRQRRVAGSQPGSAPRSATVERGDDRTQIIEAPAALGLGTAQVNGSGFKRGARPIRRVPASEHDRRAAARQRD